MKLSSSFEEKFFMFTEEQHRNISITFSQNFYKKLSKSIENTQNYVATV
jgi:hypothetical protein